MRNSRKFNEIRKPVAKADFCAGSYGSVLFEVGNTKVICAASLSSEVPAHAVNRGIGWLSAQYTMLPYSTTPRIRREFLKRDGRSVEIQRLIGRSLRCALDLKKIEGHLIEIDCDVLQADGGTRTASINGAYIALKLAIDRMLNEGLIKENPIITSVAAISIGYIDNQLMLDLDYSEDSSADVDMNIVMNSNQELIEIQGTGETATFSIGQLNEMVQLASKGIGEILEFQKHFLF